MDPVSFIKSLKIEDDKSSTHAHAPTLLQGKDQAFVDAGSLVSFVANVPQQSREDVLNGTMLAQLAANYQYDRYKDAENWYKFYLNVMENIGWVMQTFHFQEYHTEEKSLKISQVTLQILAAMLGSNAKLKEVLQATIQALAKSPEGVELFGEKSSSTNNGSFQVLPCFADKSGQVTTAFFGCHFKANSSAKNFFFFTWNSQKIKLFNSTETITLNEDVYSQVRREVKKKLGKHAFDFVKNLPI